MSDQTLTEAGATRLMAYMDKLDDSDLTHKELLDLLLLSFEAHHINMLAIIDAAEQGAVAGWLKVRAKSLIAKMEEMDLL